MNTALAFEIMKQILSAPNLMSAQMTVEANLGALDETFLGILRSAKQGVQSKLRFDMPSADLVAQKIRVLEELETYIQNRWYQISVTSPLGAPQLQVNCAGCGQPQFLWCSGFGYHLAGPTVVPCAAGGVCRVCGAQFNSLRCNCGFVTSVSHNVSQQDLATLSFFWGAQLSGASSVAPEVAPANENEEEYEYREDVAEEEQSADEEASVDEEQDETQSAEDFSEANPVAVEEGSSAQLFGMFKDFIDQEKSKGSIDEAHLGGIDRSTDRLKSVMEMFDSANRSGGSQTREELMEQLLQMGRAREELGALAADAVERTIERPQFPPGSRAERVYAGVQALKKFTMKEGMTSPSGGALQLGIQLGHLTTALKNTGGDSRKVFVIETEEARNLANEVRLFARRDTIGLARPVWSHRAVEPGANLLFFSGPDKVRTCLENVAGELGFKINPLSHHGMDLGQSRWGDLQASSLAVFDLSEKLPQVFYELGIALALGTQLLLLAEEGTELPFDVAMNIRFHADEWDLQGFLAEELTSSIYGLQYQGGLKSSIPACLGYAEQLAQEAGDVGLLHVALDSLRAAARDPHDFRHALKLLNNHLGSLAHIVVHPRWPVRYPDRAEPRCFIVMPFRNELDRTFDAISHACLPRLAPVRGDMAPGQEVIQSIWDEIGRATHITVDLTGFNPNVCLELGIADTLGRNTLLIGADGTTGLLKTSFPSIAKRRCHSYAIDNPWADAKFMQVLTNFLNGEA